LEFEPDLSGYLHEEHVENNYDKTVAPLNRVPLINQKTSGDENLNELSIEELGFSDEETIGQSDVTLQTNKVQRPYADLFEEDLVEDNVIQNEVEENTKNRKKKERNKLVVLLLGLFLIITILCGVLISILRGFTIGSNQTASLPTQLVIPTETILPTSTWTLIPTVTGTPEPTFTPTMLPTATAIVEISDKAISAANANAVLLKISQPKSGEFFINLTGNRIAITDERTIQIWNALNGEREFILSGHNDLVTDIVFSDDGNYLVSGAKDFSVILWDLDSGQAIKTFGMDAGTINRIYGDRTKNYPRDVSVDFSPDGTTIAAGAFGVVNILDIPSGLTRGTFSLSDEALLAAAQDPTNVYGFKVKFNENGWVLAAGMSKNLVGLDTLDAALLYQYELGAKGQISYTIDRKQLLEADTGGITIRNLEDGAVVNGFGGRKVKPNQAPPTYILSESAKILGIETDAAENEFELSVWNVADDASLMNFKGICIDNQCAIPVFAFFPDDERIIVARQGNDSSLEVIYVNLISHEIILRITGMNNGVKALAASPNSELAAGLDEVGILRIWNMVSGDVITSFETPTLSFVEFSRDGQFIYAWDENSIYVWGLP
jgi:WD40 repeat protein